jgi:NadR type nicotinamide-nucleotide adenylyltransferase
MENKAIKKIVVIGPESTGKSTLCKLLALHFTTEWCPEFAREYLLVNGTDYTYNDLSTIAKGQIALEEKYESIVNSQWSTGIQNHSPFTVHHSPILFLDTDMYVMKVWCEYVFGKCHQFILDEIVQRKYDLYLLCNVDTPWVKDELREYPDEKPRQELYRIYKDILINQQTQWVEISGNYNERLQSAIEAVNKIL